MITYICLEVGFPFLPLASTEIALQEEPVPTINYVQPVTYQKRVATATDIPFM